MESNHAPSSLRQKVHTLLELIGIVLRSIVIAGALVMFVFQVTEVQGSSMSPNLESDQRLVLDKISDRFLPYERGEIVVIALPDSDAPLIKRIIALEGESVAVQNNQVFVDGALLDEPYLDGVHQRNFGPTTVPQEHVFVMGDNRGNSRDSRSFGAVDVYRIIGRARFRVWPLQQIGTLP